MHTPPATLEEIRSQTRAWAEAIEVVLARQAEVQELDWDRYDQAVFIGCGSTYYLSLSAAALFQSLTGKISRAFPSSELLLHPSCAYPGAGRETLLVAISRSGLTTETLNAVQSFKAGERGKLLTVSNYEDSPLVQLGDLNFAIPSGRERSVAQTRSFASMYIACTALSALAGEGVLLLPSLKQLIPAGERILSSYERLVEAIGRNHALQRMFFLGSGSLYGLACEASLKMKEMSLTPSEPFHFMEFRHGPISMVDRNTLVVGLLSEQGVEYEQAVLADVRKHRGNTLTLGECEADIEFASGVPEAGRGVLYLPALQLLAYQRAVSFNLNPDRPRNLSAVVEL